MREGQISKYEKTDEKSFIDFEKLVRDSLFELRLDWNPDRPDLEYMIEQDEQFYGDAKSLGIIIKQLLLNTVKKDNSPDNNAYVKLIIRVRDRLAFIELKNEGDETIAKISKRVFQSDPVAKPELIEKGLGFYIVKELVTQLDGTFRIENDKTGENKITLILPQ